MPDSRALRPRLLPVLAGCFLFAAACAPSHPPSPAISQTPRPAPRQPAQVFGHEHAEWLEREGRDQLERPDEVIAAMHLKDGDVVAEIGCGTGFFSRRLAKAVGAQGKVYAEDIQPEMLSLLQEYAAKDGDANIVTVLGTATDPKLPEGQMDWILLVDVYHEFQEPKPMLARMREALKPDGRIALVEYRAEDHTADHISTPHRMSVDQVLKEWTPAGFELVQRIETLPSQHLLVFRARP
jgi:ubiquinone/menaquinone biosynthesis C-methylase UbiE